MVNKMLSFRQFLIMEEKINKSKQDLQRLIKQAIEQFRQELNSNVILESPQDVVELKNIDVHQTEQNKPALTNFIKKFNSLSQQEQVTLVKELSKPLEGKKYIENNNEIKLILIYKNNKNSPIGQEAYNIVVLNKENLFKAAAFEKVKAGQLTRDQAVDYVQEMFATLCGGGHYNEQNGGRYSLDGYDPYSGVPFTYFVQKYIILPSFNKFIANYNTSVANDYLKPKEGIDVISADEEETRDEIENIIDKSQNEDDKISSMDQKMVIDLAKRVFNDQVPEQLRLKDKEKQWLKLYFFEGLTKPEIIEKLGYKSRKSLPYASSILGTSTRNGTAVQHLKKAINYLIKQEVK